MRLAVELKGRIIGHLRGDDSRSFDFQATPESVDTFGANSTALSVSIPLVGRPVRHHAGRRRNWFTELLPEGDQYEHMLSQGGLRRGDTLSFLARYGRDIAGALQIWDVDDPIEPRTPETRPVSPPQVRALLEDPLGSPLANARGLGKSSLAGVQPKIVLVQTGDEWAQSLGGYPTTHILKPKLDRNPTTIFDEEYGSRLARCLGLADFSTDITVFDGLPALVIERFDRRGVQRIHQEDFSQILGASGIQKYQELGGVVSFRRVADSLSRHAPIAERITLAQHLILAVGIGNLDMHTKNVGLLHHDSGEVTLTPAYDVVPLAHTEGNDGRLALAVNGEYRHSVIAREDLVEEILSWGVRGAAAIVDDTLERLRETARGQHPLDGAAPGLQTNVTTFSTRLLEGKTAGTV